jgi:DNA polymerase
MKKEELLKLEREVENCERCDLHKTRTHVVFGDGSAEARIMLIGEAPGYWEDQKGKPFVGDAGKFLDELITIAGLKRNEIYIANILKCRPPGNREPKPEEIRACTPFLNKQIEIINPKIICTLGNYAASYILEKHGLKAESMGKMHGRVFKVSNLLFQLKIIPMYHPATALYKPYMREILRKDWELVKKELI